jgi:hypothetical protein
MNKKTNVLALISMIFGILSIFLDFCCGIGILFAIVSITLGFISRYQIKKSPNKETGIGFALTGIITGFFAITMVIILLIIGFFSNANIEEFITPNNTNPKSTLTLKPVEKTPIKEEQPIETNKIEKTTKPEPTVKPTETITLSQKNAIKAAENYLDYSAFSRSGLIKQLEFEGYSNEDAIFAVNSITVDWKEQAVKAAENYLDYSAFSRSGLIKQLEFEGYTNEEAVYAVDKVGL